MLKNTHIKLNLFENGLDFIQSGIEFTKKGGGSLKYAILHLASGVELILKFRLTEEHWSLIFKEIRDAKKSSLESGKFKSVDFDECINRLIHIANVDISESDKKNFNDLKERRNRIIHFNIDESSLAMKSSSLKVLNSLLDFINKYIDFTHLKEEEINKISDIKKELLDFEEFVKKRNQLLSLEIENYRKRMYSITECPVCYQDTLIINKDDINIPTCLFCAYAGSSTDIAREYIENVLHISEYEEVTQGGEFPLYDCLECGNKSLVRTDDKWLCFDCGEEWDLERIAYCNTCGTPYTKKKSEEFGMCGDCIDYRMRG